MQSAKSLTVPSRTSARTVGWTFVPPSQLGDSQLGLTNALLQSIEVIFLSRDHAIISVPAGNTTTLISLWMDGWMYCITNTHYRTIVDFRDPLSINFPAEEDDSNTANRAFLQIFEPSSIDNATMELRSTHLARKL